MCKGRPGPSDDDDGTLSVNYWNFLRGAGAIDSRESRVEINLARDVILFIKVHITIIQIQIHDRARISPHRPPHQPKRMNFVNLPNRL